jgi:hypothetical protein
LNCHRDHDRRTHPHAEHVTIAITATAVRALHSIRVASALRRRRANVRSHAATDQESTEKFTAQKM